MYLNSYEWDDYKQWEIKIKKLDAHLYEDICIETNNQYLALSKVHFDHLLFEIAQFWQTLWSTIQLFFPPPLNL